MSECAIGDCERKRAAKGYCNLHYQRLLKHGSPHWEPPTMEDRFWAKVEPTGFCWHWVGARDTNGYGVFNKGRILGRAHRVAFELLVGPIPEGIVLDHLCRNTQCCNPDHLDPVTQTENMRRSHSPAMRRYRADTCIRGHSLLEAYIRRDNGQRICRHCSNLRRRDARADR